MSNILEELYSVYNSVSNNKVELVDKIDIIKKEFSQDKVLPLFLIGVVNDFLVNEPQCYYKKEVLDEVFNNLDTLYKQDNENFINSFIKYQDNFFHSLNSYYHILDLYNELDDVGFESEIKTKIYYLPIITQLMEFCLNHFYRGVASILGELKNQDYVSQKKLGNLKDVLKKEYPNLVNIDINFRNAISHGTIEIVRDGILYSYINNRQIVNKKIDFWEFNNIKNELFDISSGAFLGLFKFIIENNIFNEEYLSQIEQDEKISFELVKLFLHNENVRVKLLSKDTIWNTHLNINLDIKNINDKNQIMVLLIYVAKIVYAVLPKFSMYIINYTHPFSIGGMLTLKQEEAKKILNEEPINWEESFFMVTDIEDTTIDNRSYKFQRFPEISSQNWKVSDIRDFSVENIKRFEAVLTINKNISTKKEIEKLLFIIIKKIRVLENQRNPKDKMKYGKIEADVVRLKVFYKVNSRGSLELLQENDRFICFVHYYRNKSIPKMDIAFQDHYIFENINKKFDIYWNKNFIG